jgi:hypothetical protein
MRAHLLMLGFILSNLAYAQNVYIIEGDLAQKDEFGRAHKAQNPLVRRTLWDRISSLALFTPGEDSYYDDGFIRMDAEGKVSTISFADVEKVFSKLKTKGYQVHFIKKTEATEFLKLVAADTTTGIFHVGHSLSLVNDPAKPVVDPNHVYLTVYHHQKPVPLTPELVAEIKNESLADYKPGKNLKLLFTGSCYASYCEAGLRQSLQLPSSVRFVAAAGVEPGRNSLIAESFHTEISKWADELPNLSEDKDCEKTLCQ